MSSTFPVDTPISTRPVNEDGVLSWVNREQLPASRRVVSWINEHIAFALTDAATIAIDWHDGVMQTVTLAGDRTFTFANPRAGTRYELIVQQDAVGTRLATWPASIKWPGGVTPTLTVTPGKKDVISMAFDGTDYMASAILNF